MAVAAAKKGKIFFSNPCVEVHAREAGDAKRKQTAAFRSISEKQKKESRDLVTLQRQLDR